MYNVLCVMFRTTELIENSGRIREISKLINVIIIRAINHIISQNRTYMT